MANEISNNNTCSVTDSDGNPVENAQIIAVKQEDTANLSQSQATEITALAKLTDANGDFTITKDELYGETNQYHVVANVENNEQRGTPNYPHVDASGRAIPDSVVSRDADTTSTPNNQKYGLQIETDVEWPEIGAEISANSSRFSTAYIHRVSDGQLMGSTGISSLSSGETFKIVLDSNLVSGETYNFVIDNGGNNYTRGHRGNDKSGYPYTSSDGNLSIVDTALGETSTSINGPSSLQRVGNVGF